jgi:hypothetical protein
MEKTDNEEFDLGQPRFSTLEMSTVLNDIWWLERQALKLQEEIDRLQAELDKSVF